MNWEELEREYTPREWDVYEVEIDVEYRDLQGILGVETGLECCGSGSQVSKDHYRRTGTIDGLFLFDLEEILMDMDKTYGVMEFGKLTREWRGHPVGSLVLVVAKGAENRKFTVGVEKPNLKKELKTIR